MCLGEAAPFGNYTVYVTLKGDEPGAKTKYIVEVEWRACTTELGD